MRYKAIAADLGAASVLAMGITAAVESANSSYRIDGAGTTATQGPDPTTMTTESFAAGGQGNTAPRVREFVLTVSQ